ncbi:MAG: hypothetical protein AB7T63_03915 [Planctomycetota bacterium]
MASLAPADLAALIDSPPGPCVSLYAPMQRAGAKTRENRIQFKNVLAEARERLEQHLARPSDAVAVLAPADRLLEDEDYWQHQSDGLALFLGARDFVRELRVPLTFEPLAVVDARFHVKPLLPLLSGNGRFFVLALSENDVRLLQGTREGVERVPLPQVPTSLKEALWMDDPERELQHHTSQPRRRDAIFHGHGAKADGEGSRLDRFCRKVDKGLQDLLLGEQAPILLAGVERLRRRYADVSKLPRLHATGVDGNVDELTDAELHDRAWQIVEPHFRKSQDEALARYRGLHGTGRTGNRLETCVPAAFHGRIDTVFLPAGKNLWGRIDTSARSDAEPAPFVQVHETRQPFDRDLLDVVAVQTLQHGGTVYAVPDEDVPDAAPLAAVFRH